METLSGRVSAWRWMQVLLWGHCLANKQAKTDVWYPPALCRYSTCWKSNQEKKNLQLQYLQLSSCTEPAVSRNRMKNSPKWKTGKHEADSTAFTIQQENESLKYLFLHCVDRAMWVFFSISLSCSHFIILRNTNTRKQRKIKKVERI